MACSFLAWRAYVLADSARRCGPSVSLLIESPGMLRIEFESSVAVSVQVPDGPNVVHVVSRRAHLRMRPVFRDCQQVSALNLEDVITQLAMPVSVRWTEPVVIDLRLGVRMRWIGAPSTRQINHFTQHELAFRRTVRIVEDKADNAMAGVLQDAPAAVFDLNVAGTIEAGSEAVRVPSLNDE